MYSTALGLPWWHWALALLFAACITGCVYVALRVRNGLAEVKPGASKLMANFREMHSQGELSEQEFRTIKTLLADDLQKELKDSAKEP